MLPLQQHTSVADPKLPTLSCIIIIIILNSGWLTPNQFSDFFYLLVVTYALNRQFSPIKNVIIQVTIRVQILIKDQGAPPSPYAFPPHLLCHSQQNTQTRRVLSASLSRRKQFGHLHLPSSVDHFRVFEVTPTKYTLHKRSLAHIMMMMHIAIQNTRTWTIHAY